MLPTPRRALVIAGALVLWVTALGPAEAAPRRLLTMRAAERAIDLAWQAELARDPAGARAALEALVATSTRSEEAAARLYLTTWLEGVHAREAALAAHGPTARGYHAAFATLKDWGPRADAWWALATRELTREPEQSPPGRSPRPGTGSDLSLPPVVVDVAGVRGAVDRRAVTKQLVQELQQRGLALAAPPAPKGAQPTALVVDVDASDTEVSAREARVTATVAIVVRDGAGEAPVVGSVSKRRREERRTEGEAARAAVRRAVEEAVDGVSFLLRLRALGRLAGEGL